MLCIYYQSDRNRICNEISIHLVSILLLLIFTLGLVMCLLPSNYAGNEEEAVIEAINNSPGNFWISIIWPITYIVFISLLRSKLEIKMWSDQLKYGSQEMGSWFYRCSPLLGFIMSKKLRGLWFCLLIKVQNATSLVFLT